MEGGPLGVFWRVEEVGEGGAAAGGWRGEDLAEFFVHEFEFGGGGGEFSAGNQDFQAGQQGIDEIRFHGQGDVDGQFGSGVVASGQSAAGAQGSEVGIGPAEALFNAVQAFFQGRRIILQEVKVDGQQVGQRLMGVEGAGFFEGGQIGGGLGLEHEDLQGGHEDRALGAQGAGELGPSGGDGGRVALPKGGVEGGHDGWICGLVDAEEAIGERAVGRWGQREEDGAQAVRNVQSGGMIIDIGEAGGASGFVEAGKDVEVSHGAIGEQAPHQGGGPRGCFMEAEEDGPDVLQGGK